MRDPHVEAVHYSVGSGEGISYSDPKPIMFKNDLGAFALEDGRLRVEPSLHFSDEEDAMKAIDPFLRSWEIETDLKTNIGSIRFTFERAEIVDRDPPPPGSAQVVRAKAAVMAWGVLDASATLVYHVYPEPPQAFRVNPIVQSAYNRWRGFRSDKEPLPAMAYFVLTVVQSLAGRRAAAKALRIDFEALGKIGELSSEKGDEHSARKAKSGTFQALTDAERYWLEQAVRLTIRRLGEDNSGALLQQITLADLPPL
jgi:hypothetical protein